MDTLPFEGRQVVVTGATGGLGGAVVALLAERGATVHVPMLEAAPPPALTGERVRATGKIDLADEAAVTGYFAGLPPLWASIHLVGGFAMAPIADTRLADLERMLSINTRTCFLACREAVKAIRRGRGGGRIVNVVARAALAPPGGMAAYVTSKAAVVGLTQALAAELVGERIWVNAIAPSIIDTAQNRAAMPDADVGRLGPAPTTG